MTPSDSRAKKSTSSGKFLDRLSTVGLVLSAIVPVAFVFLRQGDRALGEVVVVSLTAALAVGAVVTLLYLRQARAALAVRNIRSRHRDVLQCYFEGSPAEWSGLIEKVHALGAKTIFLDDGEESLAPTGQVVEVRTFLVEYPSTERDAVDTLISNDPDVTVSWKSESPE